ncbi:unnamed protein product [marine sediment metagenome]|uniref:Transposase n=2 Tax=marine sediment metagenome TaxID=412755 RepID=X1A3Q1_9ZZZZ
MNNTITYTICIDVRKLGGIKDIENKLKDKMQKAYKEIMVEILSKKEEKILGKGDYIKKGKNSRYLYTYFGLIRYSHYKAKGGDGKYTCPLDRQIGIEKNSSFSPNVQKRAVYLCVQYPYRQARDILSYELGCNVDHRSLWRLIQKKGIKLRKKRDDKVESLYTYAKPPKSDRRVREIVVIEADGTGISSQ